MVGYEKAIKRPVQDFENFAIGVVLNFIPIVNLVVSGYGLHCARNTIRGDNSLPEWDEWVDLFVHGLVSAIIGFIYNLPAIFLVLASIGPIILGLFTAVIAGDTSMVFAGLAGAVGGVILVLIISLIWILIAAYIIPAAVLQYVRDGFRFSSAFNLRQIIEMVFTMQYLIVWLFVWIYSFVAFLLLSFIPIVGSVVALFVIEVTSMTLFGELYSTKEAAIEP